MKLILSIIGGFLIIAIMLSICENIYVAGYRFGKADDATNTIATSIADLKDTLVSRCPEPSKNSAVCSFITTETQKKLTGKMKDVCYELNWGEGGVGGFMGGYAKPSLYERVGEWIKASNAAPG